MRNSFQVLLSHQSPEVHCLLGKRPCLYRALCSHESHCHAQERLPGTMPNGHLVCCVPSLLHSTGAVCPLCREAMRSMELPVDPDSGFKLLPCPASPLMMFLPSSSQRRHLQSKPYLTQNPHPESRGNRAAGERGGGGRLATGTGSLQNTLANPTTPRSGHSSYASPTSCSQPAPPLNSCHLAQHALAGSPTRPWPLSPASVTIHQEEGSSLL